MKSFSTAFLFQIEISTAQLPVSIAKSISGTRKLLVPVTFCSGCPVKSMLYSRPAADAK
jgi:hypothetical protein